MNAARFKRILLILGFLLFIVAIVAAIWYLFFRPLFAPEEGVNENANVNAPGVLPNVNANRRTNANQPLARGPNVLPTPSEVANGDITLVSDVSQRTTTSPVLASDGKSVAYYDFADGRFVRLDPATGKLTDMTSRRFPEVEKITWSPDSSKAVLAFPDQRKIVYDFTAQQQYSLPTQAQEFSFSADSRQIAYQYLGDAEDDRVLVTSDLTGNAAKPIAQLGDKAQQVQVAWSPTNEVVAMYRKGTELQRQEVFFLGQNQENFKSLATEGRGFRGKWTPDGQKLLYSVYSEATNWNPELFLVHARGDAIGEGNTDVGLATFVDKCTFNKTGTHAYCAVPDALQRGSGLYPEFAADVPDTVYTINLENGVVRQLAQPVDESLNRFTIESLFLSTDESTLYFADAANHHVHKLRLR